MLELFFQAMYMLSNS